ncbi:hypothetical protein [Tsuneonella sp. HG222]
MIDPQTRDQVGASLFHAEDQFDEIIAASAELMGGVSRLRTTGKASMLDTQKPMARLAEIQQLLTTARLKLTGVHGDLAKLVPSLKDMTTSCPCKDPALNEAAATA